MTNFEIFILIKLLDPMKTNKINFYDFKQFQRSMVEKTEMEYIY